MRISAVLILGALVILGACTTASTGSSVPSTAGATARPQAGVDFNALVDIGRDRKILS